MRRLFLMAIAVFCCAATTPSKQDPAWASSLFAEKVPGWLRPWELPESLKKSPNENTYWCGNEQQLQLPHGMSQGPSEQEARDAVAAELKGVAEMQEGKTNTTECVNLIVLLALAKTDRATALESITGELEERVQPADSGELFNFDRDMTRYKDWSAEKLRDQLVKTKTLIRRSANIEFTYYKDWDRATEALKTTGRFPPGAGLLTGTVTVQVTDPQRTGELPDLATNQTTSAQDRLQSLYNQIHHNWTNSAERVAGRRKIDEDEKKQRQLVEAAKTDQDVRETLDMDGGPEQYLAKVLAKLEARRKQMREEDGQPNQVKVISKNLGDNCYIIHRADTWTPRPCLGWLRNGNVFVSVSLYGDATASEMISHTEQWLKIMLARTAALKSTAK